MFAKDGGHFELWLREHSRTLFEMVLLNSSYVKACVRTPKSIFLAAVVSRFAAVVSTHFVIYQDHGSHFVFAWFPRIAQGWCIAIPRILVAGHIIDKA